MRQLYLHIGYPKTGTTAIQEFLFSNRERLLEHGVLYPETGIAKYAHHQIPWVFTKDRRSREGICEEDIKEGVKREVRESPDADKTVISSEGFVFAMQPEDVLDIFCDDFDEIKLIVYLRQPFRWIQSDYNQGVKGWRQLTCSFEEHLNAVLSAKNSPMNFFGVLSKWASVFGWDNTIVRSYDIERSGLVNGFLDILGIHDVNAFNKPERQDSNPRLTANQLELFRAVNALELEPEVRGWLLGQVRDTDVEINGNDQPAEGFYCRINKSLLDRVNKKNKNLLSHFDSKLFDEDFFTVTLPAEEELSSDQIDAQRLAGILRPLVFQLLGAKRS